MSDRGNTNKKDYSNYSILNATKLALTAAPLKDKGGTEPPKLNFSFFNNNVGINVKTGVTSDQKSGLAWVGLDPQWVFVLLGLVRDAINAEGEWKSPSLDQLDKDSEDGIKNTIKVGKDSNGVVYIGFRQANYTPVKFTFGYSRFHRLVDAEGAYLSPAKASIYHARAWVALFESIIPAVLAKHYLTPDKIDTSNWKGGGNYNKRGGGNYNNRNNNGGGNNQNSKNDDFGEDIPF